MLRWSRPFAVVASARTGDVARTREAVARLGLALQLLAAPRHPDRFDLGELDGCRWTRRSTLVGDTVPSDIDVLLLDTLGELASELRGAAFAVIGGTFDPSIGGHSPLEARRAGVPVVAGPYTGAQGDAFAGASVSADLTEAIAASRPPLPVHGGAAERAARIVRAHIGPPAPESPPRPFAAPLAAIVGLGADLRDALHDRGLGRHVVLPVPIISVGSTNARSPGRTSTVRALVAALMARGHAVGVVVRGYRRPMDGASVRLSSDYREIGDEGALLAAVGARVAAGPDRIAAARLLLDAGVTVIVLDDGLSLRALHRDLDIAIVDARYPSARGLLPAGERRQRRVVPARAEVTLVHHADARFTFPGERATSSAGAWVPRRPEQPVAAFAGIGRPADFLASLGDVVVDRFRALPDHGEVDLDALLRWAGGMPLVCTEKDAVRIPEHRRSLVSFRPVEVTLPQALLDRLPPARLTPPGTPFGSQRA